MPDPRATPTTPSHLWPRIAAVGIAGFVCAAIVLHLLRPELDPIDSQISRYLVGDWGALLQAAYAALSVAMVGLAIGLYRASPAEARSAAPLLLFVLGGLSLTITAYAWMDLPGVDDSLEGLVHAISAQGAFLFATSGLLLQALRFRGDPGWRRDARWLLPWAIACFAAIWVLALWRDAPRGLAQKAVILLILGWLAAVTALLWRRTAVAHKNTMSRTSS